jgi:hypothetical protein
MSIRVRIKEGTIVPLDPLPEGWADGRELHLSETPDPHTGGLPGGSVFPHGDDTPPDEADWLDDEEYERLTAILDEMRREQKDLMRRRMEAGG